MTMPQDTTEEPDVQIIGYVSHAPRVQSTGRGPAGLATEFGRWRTVIVSSAVGPYSITPGAQRLCNRNLNRHRLLIAVQPSIAAQNVLDGVLVGSKEEICSGQPATIGAFGGYLPIGTQLRWEVQSELWVCYLSTNANPVYVTVCDEVFAAQGSQVPSHE
jgi:hypothetical protein